MHDKVLIAPCLKASEFKSGLEFRGLEDEKKTTPQSIRRRAIPNTKNIKGS